MDRVIPVLLNGTINACLWGLSITSTAYNSQYPESYIYYRNEEDNTPTTWYKLRAGYADSAGTATTANGTNGGGRIVVQAGTDGGNSKGIFMWNSDDSNWGIYMAQAGGGKALSGGTAPAGYGFSQHAVRFRTYSSDSQRGWIFEGSDNQMKVSIRSSDGLMYVRGTIYTTERLDVNNSADITNMLRVYGGCRIYGVEDSLDYNNSQSDCLTRGGSVQVEPPYLAYGLYVQYTIRALGITVLSDRRIKSNVVDINDTTALDQVRKLKPKYYEYKDKVKRGSSSVIGFIAQEVKEVLPRAVSVSDG